MKIAFIKPDKKLARRVDFYVLLSIFSPAQHEYKYQVNRKRVEDLFELFKRVFLVAAICVVLAPPRVPVHHHLDELVQLLQIREFHRSSN